MDDSPPPFGTPEWYQMFLNRFDRVTVEIGFTDHPSLPPTEVLVVGVDLPDWERDWLAVQLLELFQDERGMQRYPSQLRREQDYTGWGAAGAGEHVVLLVSQAAITGTAASASWAAVQAVARLLLSRRKGAPDYPPLDREEAERSAKLQVALSYAVDADQLTIAGESHDYQANAWEIRLRDSGGFEYEVTLGAVDGQRTTLRISRRAP